MTIKLLLKYVNIADFSVCVGLLFVMRRKKVILEFPWLAAFLSSRACLVFVTTAILFFRPYTGLDKHQAYATYWSVFWIFFPVQSLFVVMTIYGIYRSAMKPLKGLRKIGEIIFRWVAGVSAGLAVFFAIGPHASTEWFSILAAQVQTGISVLALCLLLFVCLAIRPLGLTFRSHLFGVNLGLAATAAVALIQAAWYQTVSAKSMYSSVYVFSGTASLISQTIWATYFLMPEPARRMVLLPTTSPFFLWNSISEALGDEPGYVAVAGFTPDMLAPAELEALSQSGRQQNDDEDDDGGPSQRLSFAPLT